MGTLEMEILYVLFGWREWLYVTVMNQVQSKYMAVFDDWTLSSGIMGVGDYMVG